MEKETILSKQKEVFEKGRADKYERMYHDVSQKVEFATNEYNSMKTKLKELQKGYIVLKAEYDESILTLADVNAQRNKYFEENFIFT